MRQRKYQQHKLHDHIRKHLQQSMGAWDGCMGAWVRAWVIGHVSAWTHADARKQGWDSQKSMAIINLTMSGMEATWKLPFHCCVD